MKRGNRRNIFPVSDKSISVLNALLEEVKKNKMQK